MSRMADLEQFGPCRIQNGAEAGDEPHLSWDLDVGDLRSWMRAQHSCVEECPLLQQCTVQRDRLYPLPGAGPQAVIWAGVAYGDTGQVLDRRGLRRRAATQRGRSTRSDAHDPTARIKVG